MNSLIISIPPDRRTLEDCGEFLQDQLHEMTLRVLWIGQQHPMSKKCRIERVIEAIKHPVSIRAYSCQRRKCYVRKKSFNRTGEFLNDSSIKQKAAYDIL